MATYIACTNTECTEQGVPKECSAGFEDYIDQGIITCGVCSQPITQRVEAPAP